MYKNLIWTTCDFLNILIFLHFETPGPVFMKNLSAKSCSW